MDLAVAIQAVLAQHILVAAAAGQTFAAVGQAGVESCHMALLAQGWAASGEQSVMHRAVRTVAEAAILCHRRVLPEERSALLLVTLEAIVVDRGLVQAGVSEAAMGIVAVAAGGFTLGNGVAGRLDQFCLYPAV